MYTIPEDCPSQISESKSNYHASDNLFNEARSLTDDGEIVISYEYSFEDIPEGIPLDDPIYDYDNLIKRNDYEIINDVKINDKFEKLLSNQEHVQNASLKVNNEDSNTELRKTEQENLEKVTTELNDANDHKTAKTEKIQNIQEIDELKNNYEIINDAKNNDKFEKLISNQEYVQNASRKLNNEDTNTELQKPEKAETVTTELNDKNEHKTAKTEKIQNIKEIDELKNVTKDVNTQTVKGSMQQDVSDPMSTFHVIDTEKDLEFPTGLEGPIPSIVLPPKDFIPPPVTG